MTIYIVQPGDTLTSIAERFGTTSGELIRLNGMPNPDRLVIGQTVLAPSNEPLSSYPREPVFINGYIYAYSDPERIRGVMYYLSSLSIFSYGFYSDASLIPADDQKFLDLCAEFEVAPVLVLTTITESGTFDSTHATVVLNNGGLRTTLLQNLRNVMLTKGYQGLDIDFEFVNPEDRAGYLALIEEATFLMNEVGITVNTDLAPKTSAAQAGLLYESHNYRTIGGLSNTVLLMTYEWGYTYGPPMAVAPIHSVEQVIAYGITEIPTDRIYMGIPNYGYDWQLPYIRGVTKARTIGNEEAISIAAYYGAAIQFDSTAMTPYFYYRDESDTEHVVWFEDARSIVAKYELLIRYGLLGPSIWNLMRPFRQNSVILGEMFYRISWQEEVPGLGPVQ